MWVNLAELRRRVPDSKGNTLPVDLKSVTYELRDLNPGGRNLNVGGLAGESRNKLRAWSFTGGALSAVVSRD